MSLIRRRRRLVRRVSLQNTPATRSTRFVLADVRPRGLRSITTFQRPAMPRTNVVLNRDLNQLNIDFNRDVRQLSFARRLEKARLSEPVNKPLTQIKLDGKIITDLPYNHPVCVVRRARREIIFANGKSGKTGQRPRRNTGEILRCAHV